MHQRNAIQVQIIVKILKLKNPTALQNDSKSSTISLLKMIQK